MRRKKRQLQPGTRVTVTSSPYTGATGTVTGAQGSTVSIRLDPDRGRPSRTLHLMPSSVRRVRS